MAGKPNFNGRVQVHVGPATHKKIYNAAKKNDESMTAWIRRVIKAALAQKEQS